MRKIGWFGLVLLLGVLTGPARADGWRKHSGELRAVNKRLHGHVVDYTYNHGLDRRMWSHSLWERRDLYVYLPPGFEPCHKYPVMIWLHDVCQDEQSFLCLVPIIDGLIACGKLPPLIIAAPDGSCKGEPHPHLAGSFFINSGAGYFGDFVLYDVWDFVTTTYPICADRGAHVLAGAGMGGFAAYHHAIKHRYAFGSAIGIMPPLNWRWMNKGGAYSAQFNPHDWGWRADVGEGKDVIGRGGAGVHAVRLRDWVGPLYGLGVDAARAMAADNPIELLEHTCLKPGELDMYVGYVGKDKYNIDAQVESFLYTARWKGIDVGVGYDEFGHHCDLSTRKLLPGALAWLASRIAPYSPVACADQAAPCAGPHRPRRPRAHARPGADGPCYPPVFLPDYQTLRHPMPGM